MRIARSSLLLALLAGGLLALQPGPARGQTGGVEVTVTAIEAVQLELVIVEPSDGTEFVQGDRFRVVAEVINVSSVRLRDGTADLMIAPSNLTIRGPATKSFNTLNSAGSRTFRWNVVADSAGEHDLLITANAFIERSSTPTNVATASVTIEVLETTAALSAGPVALEPSEGVAVGSEFTATLTLSNSGSEALTEVEVTLHFDGSGLQVSGEASQSLGPLAPGESQQVQWRVTAVEPGLYVIMAEAQAQGVESGLTAGVSVPGVTLRVAAAPVEGGGG